MFKTRVVVHVYSALGVYGSQWAGAAVGSGRLQYAGTTVQHYSLYCSTVHTAVQFILQ